MSPTRAVIDTCIWISAYVEADEDHFKARAFIDEVQRGRHRVVVPELLVTEVVCRLSLIYRENKRDPMGAMLLGERMRKVRAIRWLNTDAAYCSRAAELGSQHSLRGVDALIALAAVQERYELITNDKDFLKSTLADVIKIRTLN